MTKNFLFALAAGGWILTGCSSHMALLTQNKTLLSPAEYVTLGHVYETQGDKPLAAKQYEAALNQDKKYVPALVALGNIAFEEEEFKKARKYFQRAHKVDAKDPAVLNNLAMAYLAEDKYVNGLDEKVKGALKTEGPATPYLWDTLAQIAIIQGRYTEAEMAIARASETAPASDPTFIQRLQSTRDQLADASRSEWQH